MAEMDDKGAFNKGKMRYTKIDEIPEEIIERYKNGGSMDTAERWRNRRPICPYGCYEEGELLEVIMKDGKAMGIYTHSGSVKPFTAELQMAPKPTGRKLVRGLDGELHYVEGEE